MADTTERTSETPTVTATDRRTGFIDPAALMRIKNMELRAKVIVQGFFNGLHRSPYHGFSVEFSEYRQYSPGDDLRYLDWRLYARTDRYYIKRFEDETNLRCYLLLDMSRSMGFGSLSYNKEEYAKTTAATIAYFLSLQRDAVGLVTFDERIGEYVPARFRTGHLHRLMMCLEKTLAGTATRLEPPIEQIASTVTKRGLIVLISDLLAPIDTLETQLGYLRSRGHEVVLMRVLDPAELNFQFDSPAMFEDLESGRDLYVDPATIRESYLEKFTVHADQIRRSCSNLGIDFYELTTDQSLEIALFDLLHARMRRGRTITRRGRSAGRGSTAGSSTASQGSGA
ncbi:MAG: DUF58 domain-containing protein [Pirellulaceae bacterium]|jgi:uncharacterized protein (DUF58 family)|nr:DUF58 domain-containing protein [Pirellulaceae bacterium]MDP6556258.1 DUF58 domain-containing protein [Pirellulaceae bacterium]